MAQGEILLFDKLKELTWNLVEVTSAPRSRFGGGQVITYGEPYWTISGRYEGLSESDFRALSALFIRRAGPRYTFTAYRPSMQAPLLAPFMSNSGLGISGVSRSGATVSMTGLGSNVISAGDMLGYYTANSGYYVGQATALATPSGGAATIAVWPPPQTPHATPQARLKQALGEFQIVSSQPSEPYSKRYSLSFEAEQVIR